MFIVPNESDGFWAQGWVEARVNVEVDGDLTRAGVSQENTPRSSLFMFLEA